MDVSVLIQDNIKKAVKNVYGMELDKVFVEHPVNEKWGDYSSNISLEISKNFKQPPIEIARNICYELLSSSLTFNKGTNTYPIFEKIEVAPPGFINFKLSKEWLHNVLYEVNTEKECYGSNTTKGEKHVLVEFSQPNPNKPLHIGHARNNFIGSSLSNILAFLGYDVIKTNYINDWGTHICKSMLMYKKYGKNAQPDKKPDHFVGDFYVMYEQKSADDPKLAEELAAMFLKLEAGDKETTELWEKIVKWANLLIKMRMFPLIYGCTSTITGIAERKL
jgi:arginyl-tRNA synthetase